MNDILQQSFLLNTELDIAGEAIYQGIKRYNTTVDKQRNTDADTFYFLYQTSIGIERLIKISHRLLQDKDKSFAWIGGHNIPILNNATPGINLDDNEKQLLGVLSDFYKHARYSHFNDKPTSNLSALLERLESIKPANLAATLARKYYDKINDLSHELNIFTYELRYGSNAAKLFYGVKTDGEQRALNELVIALVAVNKQDLSDTGKFFTTIKPIDEIYTESDIFEMLREVRRGNIPQDLIDTVDTYYDDVLSPDERKKRSDSLEIFDANLAEGLIADNEE